MAKRATSSRRSSSRSTRQRLTCPQCGFKAAHPAGLGRHRSAIHGVVSGRQRARRVGTTRISAADGMLAKRVAALERRYDRLIATLDRFVKQARGAR